MDRTLAERQLAQSPENYFLALWPILERDAGGLAGTIVYLSGFVFPLLPAAFLQEQYSLVYARLPEVLRGGVGDAPLLRSAITCLRATLGAFAAGEAWAERPSLHELLSLVLGLSLDERPKVRKQAQDCLVAVLVGERAHPGLPTAMAFVKLALQATTRKDPARALHLAPLVRRLVPGLDQAAVDGLLGPVLNCAALGNSHLTALLLGVLEQVCRTQEEAADGSLQAAPRLVQLNQSQVRKVVDGLVRLKPVSFELAEIAAPWLTALGVALGHPAAPRSSELVEPLLKALLEGLGSGHQAVHLACQLAFSHLAGFMGALGPLFNELLERLVPEAVGIVPYLLAIIRDQVVLQTAARQAVQLDETYAGTARLVAALYDRRGFAACRGDVAKALGDFVRVYGSAAVLAAVPLGIEAGAGGPSRAWLLPVLKDAVYNDELGFFAEHLMPLADRLAAKAQVFRAAEKLGDAKVYETIVFQLWALLPSYLRYPVDFCRAFGPLAPRLAETITADALLRPMLVNALTHHIQRCRLYEDDTDSGSLTLLHPIADNAEQAALLSRLAPNFLPVLFNVLGVTSSDQRTYVLEAIKALMEVSPPALVRDYFAKVGQHVAAAPSTEQAVCMLELLVTMVVFLGADAHAQLLGLALPLLATAAEGALQKAAYKAVHYVLAHELHGPALLAAHLGALEDGLQAGGELIDVSAARKCRFRLLLTLVPQLPDTHVHWVPLLLPEAVLGTKEINQKTRLLAFELLLAFGRRMARGGLLRAAACGGMLAADTPATLDEFLTMVLAGLAGKTPHMISATVVALSRLLFDLHASIPVAAVHALLADVLLLLGSPAREIVKAAFGFVKVAVLVLPTEHVQPHLPALIEAVLAWSGEHAMHFKVRVRHLLERLVRRFGYDAVYPCVPEEHRRLVVNIRKRKERLRRKKDSAASRAAGSDDEDDAHVDMDALTQAALSRQTSMMTRRGVSSSAQATRPSARFEAALYDSESDLGDDEDAFGEDETVPATAGAEEDLEAALTHKMSLRTRLTARTARTAQAAQPGRGPKPDPRDPRQHGPGKRGARLTAIDEDANEFRVNPEGKLIIEDSDADHDDDDAILVDEDSHKLYEQSQQMFSRPGKHLKFSQKRRHADDQHDDEDEAGYDARSMAKTNASRMSRLSKVAAKPAAGRHSGTEFAGKRGTKGDVKSKRSKLDPYAYVPLQRAQKGGRKERYFMSKKK